MCKYIERRYGCGHYRWIASSWCESYKQRQLRCAIHVPFQESWDHKLCGDCLPKPECPWEYMIDRNAQKRAGAFRSTMRSEGA